MKTLTLLTFLAISLNAFSQNSTVKFFTDDGQRFSVFLNGENQNPGLSTSVESNITGSASRVKIVFENDSITTIEKTVPFKANTAYIYQVKRKNHSEVAKDTRQLKRELKANANELFGTGSPDPEQSHLTYGLSLISESSRASASQFSSAPAKTEQEPAPSTSVTAEPQQRQTQTVTEPQSRQSQTTVIVTDPQPVYSTTTTVNSNTVNSGVSQPATGSVSINMNVGAPATSTYQESVTSTTVVTNTTPAPQPNPAPQVYVMPGYNGPVGCPWPMSDPDFRAAKNSIEKQPFSDNQLQIAKQIVNSNCLTSSQVREIMMIFSFEDTKLDLAKYCYGYTYDLGNYYKVNDAFTFSSSVDELNSYIQSR